MAIVGISEEDQRRIDELHRVNTELAAEIRSLNEGRVQTPRPARLPAARQLGKLLSERDALTQELGATKAKLQAVEGERDALRQQSDELQHEVVRLRSGVRGLLRRARARLLRS